MALALHPNCELCDRDLPPASPDARICSYECTFCVDCVLQVLGNVCPNCGGALVPRPIRPRHAWRPGLSLADRPASTTRVRCAHDVAAIRAFAAPIAHLAATER